MLRAVSDMYKHYGIVSYYMTVMENVQERGRSEWGSQGGGIWGRHGQLSGGTRDLFSEVPL